ncbi:MAG: hypothetical protein QG567_2067 [Campylobacterota bacterium]|nr:hypothetical protein [Campylobacterota bacterium]
MKAFLLFVVFLSFLNAQLTRDDEKEIVFDNQTNLSWQDNRDAKITTRSFKEAISWCEEFAFAGYDDWRLPSVDELFTIVDKIKQKPAIKDGFKYIISSYYWTSTEHEKNTGRSWFVSFDNGYRYSYHQKRKFFIRCVRDGVKKD